MRERMSYLTRERGMTWRYEARDTIVGVAPDARITFVGKPVTSAVLVVPATTPEEAWDALVQYNVTIEAVIDGPPGLMRGWTESELATWTGLEDLDLSISEFGFDLWLSSAGDPRTVRWEVRRNPGAWTSAEEIRAQEQLCFNLETGQMSSRSPTGECSRGSTSPD